MADATNELSRTRPQRSVDNLPEADSEDSEVLKAQIARNRARMGQTIDEIQTRLSPSYLKQQAEESIRETITEKVDQMTHDAEYQARRLRRNTVDTIKENPVPVAMIGIGLGWLLLSGRREEDGYEYQSRRYYATAGDPYYGTYPPEYRGVYREEERGTVDRATDRVAESGQHAREWTENRVQSAQETAGRAADQVQDTAEELARQARVKKDRAAHAVSQQVSEMAEHTKQTANDLQQTARRQARRTKRSMLDTFYENPLAVGVAAVAAGALVGMTLPSTQKEDELMGESRDRLVEEAKATAQQSAQQMQAIAKQAGEAAVDEAKREAKKEEVVQTESQSMESGETTPFSSSM